MKDLTNKVAVITGAGSGIGRALGQQLAKEGARVVLADNDPKGLEESYLDIKLRGFAVSKCVLDVSNKTKVYELVDVVMAKYGQVDIVINNAGVALGRVSGEEISYEDFEWVMNINFWGMVYGSKAFLPHLKKRPAASLVNISSIFGIIGVGYQAAYCSSKFAIRGFSESLRMELRAENSPVRMLSVHPGGIKTNIARNARWTEGDVSEAKREEMLKGFEQAFITSPEVAAAQIISAIKRRKERLVIGRDGKMVDFIARLFPTKYTSIIGRFLKRLDVVKE